MIYYKQSNLLSYDWYLHISASRLLENRADGQNLFGSCNQKGTEKTYAVVKKYAYWKTQETQSYTLHKLHHVRFINSPKYQKTKRDII